MKKLKKLSVVLLAVIMLLSVTVPAFANTLVDPNLCQFCGVGTYEESPLDWFGTRLYNPVPCQHGWAGCQDGMRQNIYTTRQRCTYSGCYYYTERHRFVYINDRMVCTHDDIGMRFEEIF